MTWLPTPPDVLAFRRGDRLVSITNLSAAPIPLPPHDQILLASADVVDGLLPSDSTAWLRTTTVPSEERAPASSIPDGGG
jgi:alpha-glucosidase